MPFPIRPVSFEYQGYIVKGEVTAGPGPVRLLMLHGGGQSRIAAYGSWREFLLGQGAPSAALDFIGHGATGGPLPGYSLEQRAEQALRFVEAAGLDLPLVIFASSMGAHTAIQLCQRLPVAGLLLNVPAVYDRAAQHVPFGPEFSKLIRQERSWERSQAWEILRDFQGDLMLFSAELDEVIPAELVRGLLEQARSARSLEHIQLAGAGHRYSLSEAERQRLFAASLRLFRAATGERANSAEPGEGRAYA